MTAPKGFYKAFKPKPGDDEDPPPWWFWVLLAVGVIGLILLLQP